MDIEDSEAWCEHYPAGNRRLAEQIITIRLPVWAWAGIVGYVEAATGRSIGDIEVLDVAQVEVPEPDRGES